jgi:DNA-binding response OmpR family regulator
MAATILVVDDDPDILDAVTLILESRSYQVITAVNGEDALSKLKTASPDLMILDLLMPKMDGFAVCRELQDARWSRHREMPILVLTSVREEASRRRYELETGFELGVDDYVEKPFSPEVLLDRVDRLANRNKKKRDA